MLDDGYAESSRSALSPRGECRILVHSRPPGPLSEAANGVASDVLTTIVSQDPMRSARGVARAALQIDLQLLELGDVLIDALLPFLAQRFPDLRWYRMGIRQNG
jgi:hypothetical protein